jgi:hypothetical protein
MACWIAVIVAILGAGALAAGGESQDWIGVAAFFMVAGGIWLIGRAALFVIGGK